MAGLDTHRAGLRRDSGRDRLICWSGQCGKLGGGGDLRYLRIRRGPRVEELARGPHRFSCTADGGGSAAGDAAHHQEARMKRLEDLLLQQVAARDAQVPTPPAPVEVVVPRVSSCPVRHTSPALDTSRTAPVVAPREEVDAAPPAQVPLAGAVFPVRVEGAERDRLMDRLNEFRRCNPEFLMERRSTIRL
uniref:Uncharacterized protein n=1 Tax=Ananas comosus var. bracteatus TaxID=296719 RepID=A0A6V7PR74_ANACO|nr:unnamed protein product [Ananas comosus var. bracteatus]